MTSKALVLAVALLFSGCSSLARIDYTHLFSRAGWQRPNDVIQALDIRPGQHIADIGAGEGYFTFYFADAVGPTGRVYAVEIDDARVRKLEEAVAERGYSNVVVVRALPDDPQLPDASVDVAFVCNTYHHIENRPAYLAKLRADLAAAGRVAILEPGEQVLGKLFVPAGHTTPLEQLYAEMRGAHFEPAERFDFLPLQNFEVFALQGQASRVE